MRSQIVWPGVPYVGARHIMYMKNWKLTSPDGKTILTYETDYIISDGEVTGANMPDNPLSRAILTAMRMRWTYFEFTVDVYAPVIVRDKDMRSFVPFVRAEVASLGGGIAGRPSYLYFICGVEHKMVRRSELTVLPPVMPPSC